MKSEDVDKFELLVEHMDDKFAQIGEVMAGMHEDIKHIKKRVDVIEEKLERLEPMPEVVKDHSKTLQNHEKRLLAVGA